ncbi:hypothetical protein [Gracilibacillus thailandensis]|uniref:DUF2207 domain-containing protein n=1 Tax=Gracilibacillus thailandensis TaxID=563735 RepID=A0A6N7QZD2_9BACI|nr:hypothetical protein [Gracilibacillus thailandensis]MRI66251.1 hypothetical protein [Gracilibacillus thailandensis]
MKRLINIIGLFVLLFMCLAYSDTSTAYADDQDRLEIKVEAGIDGKAKEGKGYPVTLTITNNKEDFNGDLVITLPVVNKVLPIDIASGTTKTISFSIQGMQEMMHYQPNANQNEQLFHLYEGDWKDGNEVTLDSNLDLNPTYIQPDKLVIGVLSDRPDSLNYLKLTSFFGSDPEVINLDESMITDDSLGLDIFDLLVVNDYSIAQLPTQKQESIKEWVQNDGTLITGSKPGLKQQFGSLADILPLTITGQEEVEQIRGFEAISQEPIEADRIELFTGEVDEEAAVLYQEGDIPLVMEKRIGKGAVTQIAFDLGLSQLADWQGNDPLWQSIGNDNGNVDAYMNNIGMRTVDRLRDISRTFPTLANLKVSTLAILFTVYLLVIIPILYFVLKRMDKREWAWIIIPVFAIVSSVGLYTIGAKDRGGAIKTNVMSVISLDEQGMGSGEGVISMLSKGSGSYTLSMDSTFNPIPSEDLYGPQKTYADLPFLETEENKENVHFQQVEFWSPRSVAFDQPVKEYGQISSSFSFANGTISGQVTSNFEFDLHDVYLISGQNYQEIGELAAGETKEVSFSAENQDYFQQPTEQVAYNLFGHSGQTGQQSDEQIKAELLSVAIRNEIDRNVNTPMLIGFTDQSLVPVTINGDETNQNNHHLFMQPTTIDLADDETSALSMDLQMPTVSIDQGQIYHNGIEQGDPFIEVSAGSYLLTYELPTVLGERSFQMDELAIRLPNNRNGLTFSLYNKQSDSYDSIDQNSVSYDQNAAADYLNQNQILIQVSAASDSPIDVPTVTLEGVINP